MRLVEVLETVMGEVPHFSSVADSSTDAALAHLELVLLVCLRVGDVRIGEALVEAVVVRLQRLDHHPHVFQRLHLDCADGPPVLAQDLHSLPLHLDLHALGRARHVLEVHHSLVYFLLDRVD